MTYLVTCTSEVQVEERETFVFALFLTVLRATCRFSFKVDSLEGGKSWEEFLGGDETLEP